MNSIRPEQQRSDAVRMAMLSSIRPGKSAGTATLSLAEQIALELAEQIVADRYPPGARIHEVAVSDQFDVSRGPVREALRILERIGLIEILPRRGAIVTSLSEAEVHNLFEIRAVLFGLACSRVAARQPLDLLDQLSTQLETLLPLATAEDSASAQAYVLGVQEMGLSLCNQADSEYLAGILRNLFYQTLRYSRLGLSSVARRKESAQNWVRLLQALRERDTTEADAAARTLVGDSSREAARRLREEEQ